MTKTEKEEDLKKTQHNQKKKKKNEHKKKKKKKEDIKKKKNNKERGGEGRVDTLITEIQNRELSNSNTYEIAIRKIHQKHLKKVNH